MNESGGMCRSMTDSGGICPGAPESRKKCCRKVGTFIAYDGMLRSVVERCEIGTFSYARKL